MPAPKVGQVVHNKYRLLRHIGDGGMGSVYEARHENLGTTVALKFLHLEFAKREGLVQRFLQEARASARIQSPHVVRVSDVDQSPDGEVFIVLEYLEGQTLQALYEDLYRARRKLPYGDALDYAEQMLDGVEAAHVAGIVHRDLKPDNVMVTMDAKGATVLKLLDFGIAKLKGIGGVAFEGASGARGSLAAPSQRGLTRPGVMMGTPEYMAPEQATSADAVDARADVFSLGVIIFEMLAGQRPVGGDNPLELADAYKAGKVSKLADLVPGIAPDLAAAIHRALSPNPKDRFATAAEMRDAIAPFVLAVRAPPPSRRVGGTIGVAPTGAQPVASRALQAIPPPETFEGPSLLELEHQHQPVMNGSSGAPSARLSSPASTVIDDPHDALGDGAMPDRTHRIGEPYSPMGSPEAAYAKPHVSPVSVRQAPIAIANAPASRAFADVVGGGDAKRIPPNFSRKAKPASGLPIGRVLIAAACVASAAVGITYLASRSSTKDDDAPIAAITGPGSTSAPMPGPQAQPQQAPPQSSPPAEVPAGPIPGAPPQGRPRHGGGRPKAPTNPSNPQTAPTAPASPAPSGGDPNAPPAAPAPPPALVLPSSLPFPNPFDPE